MPKKLKLLTKLPDTNNMADKVWKKKYTISNLDDDVKKDFLEIFKKEGEVKDESGVVSKAWSTFNMDDFENIESKKTKGFDSHMCIAKEIMYYDKAKAKEGNSRGKHYCVQKIMERLYKYKQDYESDNRDERITFDGDFTAILSDEYESQLVHAEFLMAHAELTRDLEVLKFLGYPCTKNSVVTAFSYFDCVDFKRPIKDTFAWWVKDHEKNRLKLQNNEAMKKLRRKIHRKIAELERLREEVEKLEDADEIADAEDDIDDLVELLIGKGRRTKDSLKHEYQQALATYKDEVGRVYRISDDDYGSFDWESVPNDKPEGTPSKEPPTGRLLSLDYAEEDRPQARSINEKRALALKMLEEVEAEKKGLTPSSSNKRSASQRKSPRKKAKKDDGMLSDDGSGNDLE